MKTYIMVSGILVMKGGIVKEVDFVHGGFVIIRAAL